ncbi:MAG TPA: STM3941 family protein [Thermoanaerobaculia bacterium]|nr:STM3941 family protein [Thermoanaerobaculia bacterium]
MNRWMRSALGIFGAFLGFGIVSMASGSLRGGFDHPAATLPHLARNAAFAFFAAALAGYLAAGIAGWREAIHGAIVGGLIGLGQGTSHFQFVDVPLAASRLASFLALAPAGLIGGVLRGAVIARRTARQPDRPLSLPLVIAPIRSIILLGGILALGMAAAGALIAFKSWDSKVGWQAMLFFGPAGAFLLYRALLPRPHLTIDEQGIHDHRLDLQFPWSDISGASFRPYFLFDFVCFRILGPERYLERIPSRRRRMMMNEGTFAGTPFGITLAGTGIQAGALCALVDAEAARRNGRPALKPSAPIPRAFG